MSAKSDRYKASGVDIDLTTRLLNEMKSKLNAAKRPEVLGGIGSFGGLFQLDLSSHREPVLVASVDGVGTKLMIAQMMEKYDTVGYDIVNHCINDIAVQGAEPLFFLDYIGIGRMRSPLYERVLGGLADACRAQHVALLGGETAEMPGMYGEDFDLVGCIIGIVDKAKLITGERIEVGDKVIGMGSSGLHTNGYSLARRVLFTECGYTVASAPARLVGETVGEALLKPHVCYWPAIRQAMADGIALHGIAHITGGGLYDNIPRVLPASVTAALRPDVLPVPPIFKLIQEGGQIDAAEMNRVFNMGVGMVWIVPPADEAAALKILRQAGFAAATIGDIVPGQGDVTIAGIG